ncbi:unnamed protein product [Adineta ricciae]|uniref:Uncharacterized protein n=1 Tax=Adineta ricciae TaxID=249248 RepID=A0A814FQN8_ADIRI|nr:unnamed protein product [Adineta ricciae]CAF0986929.1 unnamed protein product [Adineta ricciae]
MFAHVSVFLCAIVSLSFGQLLTTDRQCLPDTNDFATKVEKSSIVVYGKAMAKIMNEGSESIFHVFYQVDCILKGPATLRQINITNAGRVPGKQHCQEFPVGRGYSIAFLEPVSANQSDFKTFTPADFTEIREEGNSTSQLLARTCNLHRIVPRQSLASVADVCPPVGTHPICQEMNVTSLLVPNARLNSTVAIPIETKPTASDVIVAPRGQNEHSNKSALTPEQEIDMIRSKSAHEHQEHADGNLGIKTTCSIFLMVIAFVFSFF